MGVNKEPPPSQRHTFLLAYTCAQSRHRVLAPRQTLQHLEKARLPEALTQQDLRSSDTTGSQDPRVSLTVRSSNTPRISRSQDHRITESQDHKDKWTPRSYDTTKLKGGTGSNQRQQGKLSLEITKWWEASTRPSNRNQCYLTTS